MHKIPLLDLKAQYRNIKRDVAKAVNKVMDAQSFILGPEVDALEKEMAAYCGTRYAVGVASGTDAIKLALRAAGVASGDEVITTPFTFIATAGAASELGAIPVFADIDPKTYEIDPGLIEKKITGRTKVILPVHLYGQCADMDRINAIAKKHGLKVIEDAAQAIGAAYKRRKAGSSGLAGCISFFPSKNLGGFGDGGMVVTNDGRICDMLKVLRVHGSKTRYIHSYLGYNSRLDNLQAAILRIKLGHLDAWAGARRKNAEFFNSRLSGIEGLATPLTSYGNTHVFHQYVIQVKRSARDRLVAFLCRNGIESRVYYPIPLHLQECYKWLGYKKGDLPNAEQAAEDTLALPVYPELKPQEKAFIVKKILEFFKKGT